MVGKERIELSQYCYYRILSPARLPVPPFAQFPSWLMFMQTLCFEFIKDATKKLAIPAGIEPATAP